MSKDLFDTTNLAEIIDGAVFSTEEFARLCGVTTEWIQIHVQEGILKADMSKEEWRFDSACLIRARRIIHLETSFEADPQLAALTADLIDELNTLRQQLKLTE